MQYEYFFVVHYLDSPTELYVPILQSLRRKKKVILDFSLIESIEDNFILNAIGRLYFSELTIEQLNRGIEVSNITEELDTQLRGILKKLKEAYLSA